VVPSTGDLTSIAASRTPALLGVDIAYAYSSEETRTNTLTSQSCGAPSNPATLSVQSRFAPVGQAGAARAFNERWIIDGMVSYTWLKNTTTLSMRQMQVMTLNPATVSVAIDYRF
jgi:outer membrane protein